ncbi:MAG: NnrU family protein, partial [Burkholderiales bacterium]
RRKPPSVPPDACRRQSCFITARRRDRVAGTVYPAGSSALSALVVAAGLVVWVVFAFWGHRWLIGVGPFG